MSDDPTYPRKEMLGFITSSVSVIQHDLVLKALDATTVEEVDDIGLTLAGEKAASGFIYHTGTSTRSGGEFWQTVKREVYDFVCTNSAKYKKERGDAGHHFGSGVTVIATALAAQFHLGIGVVTGIVTVGLISVAKIGKNAWCSQQAPENKQTTE